MPVMKMHFSLPLTDPYLSQRLPQPNPIVSVPLKTGSLRSSMISRIHNTPPGCSSCGKR